MKRSIVYFILMAISCTFAGVAPVASASCPRHRIEGVSASACQIGDDIQVLAHNYNDYPVSFSVKVTYQLRGEGERTRWVEGRLMPDGGGQLADWRNPDHSLTDVTDVEVRNVVKQ